MKSRLVKKVKEGIREQYELTDSEDSEDRITYLLQNHRYFCKFQDVSHYPKMRDPRC